MRSQKSKSNAIGRCSSSGVFFLSLSAPTGTRSLPVPARFSSRLRGPDKNTSSSLSRSTQKGQEPSGRRGAAVGAGIDQKKREKKNSRFFFDLLPSSRSRLTSNTHRWPATSSRASGARGSAPPRARTTPRTLRPREARATERARREAEERRRKRQRHRRRRRRRRGRHRL